MGFFAIALWATAVAAVRSLTAKVGPVTAGAVVYLLGGVLGVLLLIIQGRLFDSLRSLNRHYLFICGGLFVVYVGCLYAALGLATSSSQAMEMGLINYLWPMLTVIFSIWILKYRSNALLVPSIIFAAAGIFLATTQGQTFSWQGFVINMRSNPIIYLFGTLAAVSWGAYSVLSRKFAADVEGNVVPVFMLITGLILGVIRTFAAEKSSWTFTGMAEILYIAISTIASYSFWDMAMRHGNIILVASVSYLLPLFSVLIAALYLQAPLTPDLLVGAVFVILGAVLSNRSISNSSRL